MDNIFTKPVDLQERLPLSGEDAFALEKIAAKYPIAVSGYYLSLIDPSDPDDPIRKMCIPSLEEMDASGDLDTSGEFDNTVSLGLQHKYRETALIISTNRCATYCRHCFRKRMVGASEDEVNQNFLETARYISEHKEISNVLLSGGDALMMSNRMIERYLSALTEMEHLDLIRLGTRIPVVMPSRVIEDEELKGIFRKYSRKKQLYLITQFNHPKELTEAALECLNVFKEMGIVARNQTVLLKGVNDNPETLGRLLKRLTAFGVAPYYVFQCRPVQGVKSQFQVPLEEGYEIVEKAKAMQNGLGKCFRYCMSLPQGKVEVLGKLQDGKMLFKFHQAKERKNEGKIFALDIQPSQCWLDLSE